MATVTLTKANPTAVFEVVADGDVQVIISSKSNFTGLAVFSLQYETVTPGTYIPVPDTASAFPYARIYTFKAGNLKLTLEGANSVNTVKVDIK
jgi:hypothetical protein